MESLGAYILKQSHFHSFLLMVFECNFAGALPCLSLKRNWTVSACLCLSLSFLSCFLKQVVASTRAYVSISYLGFLCSCLELRAVWTFKHIPTHHMHHHTVVCAFII